MELRLFLEHPGDAPQELGRCPAEADQPLSRSVWLSGLVPPAPLCSGLGRCGRCRARIPDAALLPPLPGEERILGAEAVAGGMRLLCRHAPPAGDGTLDVILPADAVRERRRAVVHRRESASGPVLLAADLGTTSLCWRMLSPADGGAVLAEGSMLNPQAGAGADVMSRLAAARDPVRRARLAEAVRRALREIVADALPGAGVSLVCLAANTAMTDIFLDRDISGLCAAPWRLSHAGDEILGVPGLPPVYVPPLPAPFVGGDVSAGLAALMARDMPRPLLLADLGTNGEMALLDAENRLFLASVPLGPALEGIGPECGRLAGPDVLTSFFQTPAGLGGRTADGRAAPGGCAAPAGIGATGYLSLIALLLRCGLLTPEGGFVPPDAVAMPMLRRVAAGVFQREDGSVLPLPGGLRMTAADVEELLKVRAAFALAVDAVIAAAGLSPAHVASFCLAGALGEHVRPEDLETCGFLPPGTASRVIPVGNSSLDGAALLAADADARRRLAALCAGARVLSLTDAPGFSDAYLSRMRFAWTGGAGNPAASAD